MEGALKSGREDKRSGGGGGGDKGPKRARDTNSHRGRNSSKRGRTDRRDRDINRPSPSRKDKDDRKDFRQGDFRRGNMDRRRGGNNNTGGGNGPRRVKKDTPRKSTLHSNIKYEDRDGELVFLLNENEVISIKENGEIQLVCSMENRDKDSAEVVNMVVRPFALQLVSQEEDDFTSQWYLTDGKEYRVKCLLNSSVSGPVSLQTQMTQRIVLLQELLEKECLWVDLSQYKSVVENASSAAVRELFDFCRSKEWEPPQFHFDKVAVKGQPGFIFKISFPNIGMNVGTNNLNWDADFRTAKNKAAEKALEMIQALGLKQ